MFSFHWVRLVHDDVRWEVEKNEHCSWNNNFSPRFGMIVRQSESPPEWKKVNRPDVCCLSLGWMIWFSLVWFGFLAHYTHTTMRLVSLTALNSIKRLKMLNRYSSVTLSRLLQTFIASKSRQERWGNGAVKMHYSCKDKRSKVKRKPLCTVEASVYWFHGKKSMFWVSRLKLQIELCAFDVNFLK